MDLDINQIEHLARLARLELSAEEKAMFTEQLATILNYFEKLKEIDTTGIEPVSQSVVLSNIYQDDEISECPENIKSKILSNAPEKSAQYFKVKKIL